MPRNTVSALSRLVVLSAVLALCGCPSEDPSSLVALGKIDMAKKDAAAAVIRFKTALQTDPDNNQTRILLGSALLESGDAGGAIVELSRVLAQKAEPALVMPLLGRAHIQAGQFRKLTDAYATVALQDKAAEGDFKSSLAIAWGAIGNRAKSEEAMKAAMAATPNSSRTLTTQARLLLLSGDADGALAVADRVLAADPKLHEVWDLKGEILSSKAGGDEQARVALDKALELDPKFLPSLARLVTLRVRAGDLPGAKKQLEALRTLSPHGAETVFLDAQMALMDKDFRKARDGVQQLLKVAPDNPNLLQLAAAVEWQGGSLVIAEKMLSSALRSDPSLDQARVNLAHIFLRMGQPARAFAMVEPLLKSGANKPSALGAAGEAALQLGNLAAAEDYFSRAATGSPDDTRLGTSVAMTQLARGNSTSAFAQLDTLVAKTRDGYVDSALISAHLKRGELDPALTAADNLVRKQPDSASAQELRGRVLLARRDFVEARKAFNKAASLDSASLAPVNQLAYLDIQEGHAEAALPRFEDYLKRNPGGHLALMSLADLRVRLGAPKKEIQALLTDAIKAAPDEPAPRLNLIELLADQRQTKAALAAAQEAAAALPEDIGVLDALGRMQAADGNWQQALSTFRRITTIDPNVASAHLRMAGIHKAAGNRSAAVASLRRVLEIDPRSKSARADLVELLVDEKRSKEAVDLARDMQRRDPQSAAGYLLEGAVLRKLKDNEGTIPVYRLGMRNAKDKAEIALNLFIALLASKEPIRAEPFAKEWLASNPQDGAMHYNLGEVYMTSKAYDAAEFHFKEALKIRPDFVLALNNLAWVLVQQGKPGAAGWAQRAVNLSPDQPALLDTLAQSLAAEGKVPQALEAQKQAAQLTPGDPGMRFRLAQLAIKAGDKALARSELEQVLAINARNPFREEAAKLVKGL